MLKNYFKIAWRNLWRNKGFSLVNITGLAIGMAAAALISLWVWNELNYDQFHDKGEYLYKVWNRATHEGSTYTWPVTSSLLGPTLEEEVPGIGNTARTYWPNERLFTYEGNALTATGLDVDPAFLSMFSFPLVQGSSEHALDKVHSVVITESLGKRLFGNTDPLNKILFLDDKDAFTVTGVLKDLPSNTQFEFDYLVPWTYLKEQGFDNPSWGTNGYNTYIELSPGTSAEEINRQISRVYKAHSGSEDTELFLHPISKWRLYSRFENGEIAGGRIEMVRLFGLIAALVLLIACINFMNLSTARSEKRAKEIGVKKVLGAGKSPLVRQFLVESLLLTGLAGIIALPMTWICLPAFNALTGHDLSMPFRNPYFYLCASGFVLLTGLLAGSYPAFFLSSFQPLKAFKGVVSHRNAGLPVRKVLVIVQFTCAIVLIACTFIIHRQIRHVKDRDSGYAIANLVEHPINGDIRRNYEIIKNELINSGAAVAVCKSSLSITVDGTSSTGYAWRGKDPASIVSFDLMATTGDFVKTFGLHLVQGRDIDLQKFPADSTACLLNETAVNITGFKEPIGQTIRSGDTDLKVVGVIKDFILGSPYQMVDPMIVEASDTWAYRINIRLNENNPITENIETTTEIFKKYNPAYPFDYTFVDEEYARKFDDEQRISKMAALFAGLIIFISCLGVFSLTAYIAGNRAKEIGIRKVLGASVSGVVILLSKDFVKLVLFAIVIAIPIAWYAMNRWLQEFAYRIELQWWIFALAGLLAMMIALLTVSFQSVKAALMNPVKSLRSE